MLKARSMTQRTSTLLVGAFAALAACTAAPDGSSEETDVTASGDASSGEGSSAATGSTGEDGTTSTGSASDSSSASTSGEAGTAPTSGMTEGPTAGTTDTSSSTGGPVDYQDVYPLAGTYPEGGAFDPVDELFFVGTLEGGDVYRVDPRDGSSELFFAGSKPGLWMTLGMAIDAERRRLWVCAADRQEDPYTGEVWVFDLESGARDHVIPLMAGDEAAWCEDIAVAGDGRAYATDRENPNIYRIEGGEASLFASDEALGSNLIGQNGIVVLPGDDVLIAAVHLPSRLNRVSLADGTVTPIDIEGDFVDAGIGSGADGMVYVDGGLYVIFDGELARVEPTLGDWSAVYSTAVELPRGLTDVVQTPAGLYLINGQAIGFAFGQDPNGPFQLVRYTGDL